MFEHQMNVNSSLVSWSDLKTLKSTVAPTGCQTGAFHLFGHIHRSLHTQLTTCVFQEKRTSVRSVAGQCDFFLLVQCRQVYNWASLETLLQTSEALDHNVTIHKNV